MFFKTGDIGRTYRHMQRYRQILTVLFKYGFGDLVVALKIEQYLEIGLQMISSKRREKIETLSRAVRVRMVLEELGPTFLKMGQILSTRPDILPVEFMQELSKLQDEVPPFPYSEVQATIQKEFNKSVGQKFSSFDEQPLAAASIGQVHKAKMPDGKNVVVKIQRPGIQRTIKVDLEIMMHLAGLMELHLEGWDIQRPTRIVEEFARTLEKELDYTLEAAHMERFARQFEDEPAVYVPQVYREATTLFHNQGILANQGCWLHRREQMVVPDQGLFKVVFIKPIDSGQGRQHLDRLRVACFAEVIVKTSAESNKRHRVNRRTLHASQGVHPPRGDQEHDINLGGIEVGVADITGEVVVGVDGRTTHPVIAS